MTTVGMELVPRELQTKVMTVVDQAKSIVISDPETYRVAALFVKESINPILKELDATFDPIIEKAHLAHKEALRQKGRHLAPLTEAKEIATNKCKVYEDEQERIRKQQQREVEEAARKQEEEDRLTNAAAAEDAGAPPEEVEAILETPAPPAPVRVAPTFERVTGVTRNRPYSAQVTSLAALICYIAGVKQLAHPELQNCLLANQVALNAKARAEEYLMNLPGVKAGRF